VILLQGVLAAINMMTQVNAQLDQRNVHMAQQQMQLQAATLRSNAQQLANLGGCMGNIGTEVGKAIANNPTRSTMHATISQPNAVAGQSNDPTQMGSLMHKHPVRMSVPDFDYDPHVQSLQPQPNDKNARCIDEVTHQIMQKDLPPSAQRHCDAAHASGATLPENKYVLGFCCVVENRPNSGVWIRCLYFWHLTFGTGAITSSGCMLQPNIQERDFQQHAPILDGLDLAKVCQFYCDLCWVGHDCWICLPSCEEFCPASAFTAIECGDTPTARVPKFCQSQVP